MRIKVSKIAAQGGKLFRLYPSEPHIMSYSLFCSDCLSQLNKIKRPKIVFFRVSMGSEVIDNVSTILVVGGAIALIACGVTVAKPNLHG